MLRDCMVVLGGRGSGDRPGTSELSPHPRRALGVMQNPWKPADLVHGGQRSVSRNHGLVPL